MLVTVELIQVTCCSGCVFAISKDLYDFMKRKGSHHENISCPLGHKFHYLNESDKEHIERLQLDLQRKDNELAEEREKQRKLERRIHSGLCPFCRRTFTNVRRHMSTKHPVVDVTPIPRKQLR